MIKNYQSPPPPLNFQKNKEKPLIKVKRLFYLLFISLFFYACETDDFITDNTSINSNQEGVNLENSSFSKLSYGDIESKTELLNLISRVKSGSANLIGKSAYNETFQMELDTTTIYKVTSDWRHSYTFRIVGDSLSDITQNLVLSYAGVPDSYYAYIVSYNLTDQEEENIRLGTEIDLATKISLDTYNPDYTTYSNVLLEISDCSTTVTIPEMCPSNEHNFATMDPEDYSDCTHVKNGSYTPSGVPVYNVLVDLACLQGGSYTPTVWPATPDMPGTGEVGGGFDDNNDASPDEEDPYIAGPVTVPNLKGSEITPPDPCYYLNNMTTEKTSINNLKTYVIDPKEHGYFYSTGSDPEYKESEGLSSTIKMSVGGKIYGCSHTHPYTKNFPDDLSKPMPMFSLSDIMWLGYAYAQYQGEKPPVSKFVITMTIKTGTGIEHFAVKIENYLDFISKVNKYAGLSKGDKNTLENTLSNYYTELYEGGEGGSDEYLKMLFKFLYEKDYYGGLGVYKATDENMSNWEKQKPSFDNNGNVTQINEIPCE